MIPGLSAGGAITGPSSSSTAVGPTVPISFGNLGGPQTTTVTAGTQPSNVSIIALYAAIVIVVFLVLNRFKK